MNLAKQQTPEQAELVRRRIELAALRATLIEHEHALDDLRAKLLSFEGRYIRQVGKLYKQLDEWERKIAELDSPLLAKEELEPSQALDREDDPTREEAEPPDLKALFRELARRVHPDFAESEADAEHRTRLMAQANDAFRRKDAGMLQRMLNGHDAVNQPEDTAAELALVMEQLATVEQATVQAQAEKESLAHSELAKLQERTIAASLKGRDLLAEMAARVKGGIGMAMRRYELDLERKKRNQPAFDLSGFLSAETAPAPKSNGSGAC